MNAFNNQNTMQTPRQTTPSEGVPPSNSPQGSPAGMFEGGEEKETASEVLMEKLCQAALKAFVRLGGKRVTEAGGDQLERACAAMREAAVPVYDVMIADARETVGIENYVFLNVVLELAQVGLNALPSN